MCWGKGRGGGDGCCCQSNELKPTYFFGCLVSGMKELDQAKPEPREAEKFICLDGPASTQMAIRGS